jgi:hypothetical protein
MTDLTEFETQRDSTCVIGRSLESLDDADREKLLAALKAGHIQHRSIARWLRGRGLEGSENTVGRHRRGECCCA